MKPDLVTMRWQPALPVNSHQSWLWAGADPELLLGGGTNPQGGRQPNILVIFSEKPYEIKEFWSVGGAHRVRPP